VIQSLEFRVSQILIFLRKTLYVLPVVRLSRGRTTAPKIIFFKYLGTIF
jgi:hypothetical protein